MEEDLHGPGIDARGAAFAGVNLYVQLGHGRDYAWSATTATSDNVDTFAEVLCKDNVPLPLQGQVPADGKAGQTESWTPNAIDTTPPGSQTLTAYRTVHGIVFARGKVHGKKVAFVHQRSTYFHEADSVIGFAELNEPGVHDRAVAVPEGGLEHQLPLQLGLHRLRAHRLRSSPGRCRSAPRAPRPTSRSSAPASTTGRASTRRRRRPTSCRSPSTRRPSTRPTSSPGTTSRRRNGRPPTTSTPTGRSTASR